MCQAEEGQGRSEEREQCVQGSGREQAPRREWETGPWELRKRGSEVRVKPRSWSQGRAGVGREAVGAAGLGWGTALRGTAPMLLLLGVFSETLGPTTGAAATCEP